MFIGLVHFKALRELVMEDRSPEILQHTILKKSNESVGAYYVILYVEF